jgi:polyisoprenoid-binding protein YceI
MKILIITLYVLFSLPALAKIKIINSEVKFSAIGKPSFIKANGSLPLIDANFILNEDQFSGDAKVSIIKLNSGIESRDKHLKEAYLHAKKFPEAELLIKEQKVSINNSSQTIRAILKLHGIEKEIELDTKLSKEGKVVSLESNFEIRLSDFSIELPSFKGITAANKVKINVVTKFEL